MHYSKLPWPSVFHYREYEVLDLRFVPHSTAVFVHTENFTTSLPSRWSKDCNVEARIAYWNMLPGKLLRGYWADDDELRWELWADHKLLGYWSKYFPVCH